MSSIAEARFSSISALKCANSDSENGVFVKRGSCEAASTCARIDFVRFLAEVCRFFRAGFGVSDFFVASCFVVDGD